MVRAIRGNSHHHHHHHHSTFAHDCRIADPAGATANEIAVVGGVEMLISAADTHAEFDSIVAQCIAGFAALASHCSCHTKTSMNSIAQPPHCVALRVVHAPMITDPLRMGLSERLDLPPTVVQAMQRHTSNVTVQKSGCRLFARLAGNKSRFVLYHTSSD